MRSLYPKLLRAALLALCAALPASAAAAEPEARPGPAASLLIPPLHRGMFRVHGAVRPFFNITGPGGGALTDLAAEYYFQAPWKLGVELSPLIIAGAAESVGVIAHPRLRAALATDYLEVGLGVGARIQRFGPSGWSVAPALRLGSLDGLNLRMEFGYSLIRNYYTSQVQFAWSHVIAALDIPVARRLAIQLDGGYGLDLWVYSTLGLRHVLHGDGGPGTLAVGAAFGAVWAVDRFPCQYGDIDPCRGAPWTVGPTIAFRIDQRF